MAALLLAIACSGGGRARLPDVDPVTPSPVPLDPADPANVAAHLVLPRSEEARREAYAAEIVRAHQTVSLFATAHGWSDHVPSRPYDAAEILPNAQALWERLLELAAAPPETESPPALPSAALEARVLVVLTEAGYRAQAPQDAALPDAWRRLVAHELVHRLHVAVLAASGRGEDAMGPRWFYEGLAVLGSGQDLDLHAGIAYPDVASALGGVAGGPSVTAYRRYAAAVRLLARKVPLPELVARAGDEGFEAWLRGLDGSPPEALP